MRLYGKANPAPHLTPINSVTMERPASMKGFNLVHKYEKKQLLFAINCMAGLSIAFFGYDQGSLEMSPETPR